MASGLPARQRTPALPRQQIREFLACIDALAERLAPPRRRQDAREPECSRTELRVLAALSGREPMSMTTLAAALEVPISTATRTVDKLVAKGLVERRGVYKDRRIVQIGFSPRGHAINHFVTRSRRTAARRVLRSLETRERAVFLRFLAVITKAAAQPSSATRHIESQPSAGNRRLV